MRMSHFFKYSNFSINSINIALIFDFVFLQNLDGNFVSSDNVCSLFHFTKCTFSFGFAYDKATNSLPFTILFLLWAVGFLLIPLLSCLLGVWVFIWANCLLAFGQFLILNFFGVRHFAKVQLI